MSDPESLSVELDGVPYRVWRKGRGPRLGFLAGWGGLPRWTPFLDRLAERRTVIVPSLPGFPGGGLTHKTLDSHLDWLLAVRGLLRKADLFGADLLGSSVGGALAADVAAVWPEAVRRLALIAPFGLFEESDPPRDPWALRPEEGPALFCADPECYRAAMAMPAADAAISIEWEIESRRAAEAAARFLWPLGNTRLDSRLHLIEAPTLVLWGEHDRVIPRSYADRLAATISGGTRIVIVPGAGHLAELDRPDAVADAVLAWMA